MLVGTLLAKILGVLSLTIFFYRSLEAFTIRVIPVKAVIALNLSS